MLIFSSYSVVENSICVNIIDSVCVKFLSVQLLSLNRGLRGGHASYINGRGRGFWDFQGFSQQSDALTAKDKGGC